jgi:hypothetical protein
VSSYPQDEAGEDEISEPTEKTVEDPAYKRRRERALNEEDRPDDPNVTYVYSNIGESIQDEEDIEPFEKTNSEGKKKPKSVAFSQSVGEVSEEERSHGKHEVADVSYIYHQIMANQQNQPMIRKQGRQSTKKNGFRFQEDIRKLMYGFGDDLDPLPESTELMEQYLVEFLANTCNRNLQRSMRGGHTNMQLGDLCHLLQPDPKKFYRIPLQIENLKQVNHNHQRK